MKVRKAISVCGLNKKENENCKINENKIVVQSVKRKGLVYQIDTGNEEKPVIFTERSMMKIPQNPAAITVGSCMPSNWLGIKPVENLIEVRDKENVMRQIQVICRESDKSIGKRLKNKKNNLY